MLTCRYILSVKSIRYRVFETPRNVGLNDRLIIYSKPFDKRKKCTLYLANICLLGTRLVIKTGLRFEQFRYVFLCRPNCQHFSEYHEHHTLSTLRIFFLTKTNFCQLWLGNHAPHFIKGERLKVGECWFTFHSIKNWIFFFWVENDARQF